MNDKALADKVVALGIGTALLNGLYCLGEPSDTVQNLHADVFVREWRVAGALMEKCWSVEIDKIGCPWWVAAERPKKPQKFRKAENESLPRAIIEACAEALDSVQTGTNQHD